MTSIGETLRGERLRRNLELDRISNELKISARLLEAMEADRFDKLPGGVFTRSFVRQYARLLGLDDQEIAFSLQRMLDPPPVPLEVVEPVPHRSVRFDLPSIRTELESGRQWVSSSSLQALGLLGAVVLVCSALYSWIERGPHYPGVANRVAAAVPPATPPKPITASVPIAPPPSAPATPIVPAGSAERLAAPVQVQLAADAPVWILATKDGKFDFSGTIEPHNSHVVEANGRVFLKIGNAGGARLWLNGKPLGPLGKDGQVVSLQFTSGGFQVVPAEAGPTGAGDSPKDPLDPL